MMYHRHRHLRKSGSKLPVSCDVLEERQLLAAAIDQHEFQPNEILIQFTPGTTATQFSQARAAISGVVAESIQTSVMKSQGFGLLQRLTLRTGMSVEKAISAAKKLPFVKYAEPNYIFRPTVISNDPRYTDGSLWGMYSDDAETSVGPVGTTSQFGSQAEQAWDNGITGSSSVIIGIIDEGIQITHPDLNDNIWVNPFEIANDGKDNDGNGYIDDINGWDFVHNDKTVYDAGEDSHGTHVAGTIGGEGNNGLGVAGINWDVSLIAAKFLGPNGGTLANAIKAVDYLTDLRNRHGINIVASNNSWGGGGYSQALHDAIIRAANSNILFVAAAGNDASNNDSTVSYPSGYRTTTGTSTQPAASYDSVISVASITSTGTLSSFSNYGNTSVDLGAPGSGIWSSVPTDSYASYNGTSMATPHVTGAVALYASTLPAGTAASAIRTAVLNSTTPTSSLAGKTSTGGRLNVATLLRESAALLLDQDAYGLPDTITVTVNHAEANASSTTAETVTVEIRSTSEGTDEVVTLTETGVNTGRFVGTIALLSGAPTADGVLQAAHNDQITATYTPLNRTAQARVDTAEPLLSGISTVPRATSADVKWNTDEQATSEVLYGTTSGNLDRSMTLAALTTQHSITLTGLSPSMTYHFQIRSQDAAGNVVTSTPGSFVTQDVAPILFVDDDQGAAYDRFFRSALEANGYQFDIWDASGLGRTPSAPELQNYRVVIWNAGFDYSSATAGLSSSEQDAITAFLNGGGRIYVTGQDIMYNGLTTSFRQNYMKVASFSNDVISTNHTETGVAGNPISSDLSLPITKPSDYPSLYVDGLTPVSGATGLLRHGAASSANPFSAVSYRGNYTTGGFGVVFSTVPFEGISAAAADPGNQKEFLRRVVSFLADTAAVNVSALSSSSTTEAGGTVTFNVVLATKPAANVVVPVSSSDSSEGVTNVTQLTFTPATWNIPQPVTVTGQDDGDSDGNTGYVIQLGKVTSADIGYKGIDPADVGLTNLDNDIPATRFYVVNDGSPDRTYEYGPIGQAIENYSINSGNSAPRGIATTASGDKVWVVDRNRRVYVYNKSGVLLGSWAAGTIGVRAAVEGIATDGTSIWIVDATADRVYYYQNAASRLTGSANANSNFLLNTANRAPKDIVTDGTSLWVVNDTTTDKVFRYNLAGTLQNSWTINTANKLPTGIAIDPSNASQDIWIVDSGTDRVYRYANGRTLAAPVLSDSFALSAGNTNPQGIADPPVTPQVSASHAPSTDLTTMSTVPQTSVFAGFSTTLSRRPLAHELHSSLQTDRVMSQLPGLSSLTRPLHSSSATRTLSRLSRLGNGLTRPLADRLVNAVSSTVVGLAGDRALTDDRVPAGTESMLDLLFARMAEQPIMD